MGNLCPCLYAKREPNDEPPKPAEPPKTEEPTAPKEPATGNEFAQKLLEAHNEYRMKHGADPLTLDEELCKKAQEWANHLAESGNLQHADTEYGENLAFASPELTAQGAADMWYNEIKDYDFKNPGFTGGTGHFTQLVWCGSEKFGAGIAEGSKGKFAVGRYSPAGNVTNAGYFEKNVLPAK